MAQPTHRPTPRLTHRRAGTLIVVMIVAAVGVLLALTLVGFEVLSVVRAYINGESIWAKSQKDATLHLLRYYRSGDEAELTEFHARLAVQRGDRVARLELERDDPEWERAWQGFIEGGNHPDDVEDMATAFRRLRAVWFVDSAIAVWTAGDAWIDSLVMVGEALGEIRSRAPPPSDTTTTLLARIHAINAELTRLEYAFSGVLGDGARWTQRWLGRVALAVSLLLIALATTAAWITLRTMRRQAHARRESETALQEGLRRAQKMEAVGQLTGGIAHDFNNLLTIISANAEILARELPTDDPDLRRGIQDLKQAAHRGAGLVRRLLAFGQREPMRATAIDLVAAVTDSLAMFRRILPASIRLVAEVDPGLPPVLGDTDAVNQILLNLAMNARDAMPEGGTLTVRADRMEDAVRLVVRDSGVGMDAATRQRAFEPFFSTKAPGAGTGLGLAMVEQVTRQLGGSVELRSTPGHGTEIELRLRLAEPHGAVEAAPEARLPRGAGERVLIVEDDAALRAVARRALGAAGYEVCEASDGREAMAILEHDPEATALVLSDVVMPHMGGRELYAAARQAGIAVPFVFMSGYAPGGFQQPGLEGVPLLTKPWTVPELLATIRGQLDA